MSHGVVSIEFAWKINQSRPTSRGRKEKFFLPEVLHGFSTGSNTSQGKIFPAILSADKAIENGLGPLTRTTS